MDITYSNVAKPIAVIKNFLPADKAAEVLQECIDLEHIYRPAEILDEHIGARTDDKVRKNQVVYLSPAFQGVAQQSKILEHVVKGLQQPLFSRGIGFGILAKCTRFETVLSRYGDEDFYDFHRDYNLTSQAHRLISAVYYANSQPKQFEGGELEIKGEQNELIEPEHNKLVIFYSGALHRVRPVKMLSDKFAHGRFSINIWCGFRS